MKNGILAVLLSLIVLFGCAPVPLIDQDSQEMNDIQSDNVQTTTDDLDPIKESSAMLEIPSQEIVRDIVYIPKAVFDKAGFVAIYTLENGVPKQLVGVSDIYLAGEYHDTGVEIKEYQDESQLVAMVYYDDIDTRFDSAKDTQARNGGKPVSVVFGLQ